MKSIKELCISYETVNASLQQNKVKIHGMVDIINKLPFHVRFSMNRREGASCSRFHRMNRLSLKSVINIYIILRLMEVKCDVTTEVVRWKCNGQDYFFSRRNLNGFPTPPIRIERISSNGDRTHSKPDEQRRNQRSKQRNKR